MGNDDDRKWSKIKFRNLHVEPSYWNCLIDTQVEDITNHSAFIRADIYDESGEKIVSCDLPCWIGINARKILEERKTKENEEEKTRAQEEELRTIRDKLQAISDVQNRYLPDFEKVQEADAVKENLEAALNDIKQLKERLQKYEEV